MNRPCRWRTTVLSSTSRSAVRVVCGADRCARSYGDANASRTIDTGRSAIGTLVECTTEFTILLHLRRIEGYGIEATSKLTGARWLRRAPCRDQRPDDRSRPPLHRSRQRRQRHRPGRRTRLARRTSNLTCQLRGTHDYLHHTAGLNPPSTSPHNRGGRSKLDAAQESCDYHANPSAVQSGLRVGS
jgi:hypothetical protein